MTVPMIPPHSPEASLAVGGGDQMVASARISQEPSAVERLVTELRSAASPGCTVPPQIAKEFFADAAAALSAQKERGDNEDKWRELALQFDRHRIAAMSLIRAVAQGHAGPDDCAKFADAPPPPPSEGRSMTPTGPQTCGPIEMFEALLSFQTLLCTLASDETPQDSLANLADAIPDNHLSPSSQREG